MSQSGNPKIICDDCGKTIAGYKDGVIVIYPQNSTRAHDIPVEWVFEAIRQGKGKGIEKLQIFVEANHCIFG